MQAIWDCRLEAVYSASKGALELITESYRMELKLFGITMSNVAPGDFATNIAAGRYHAPILENSPYKVPYGTTLRYDGFTCRFW